MTLLIFFLKKLNKDLILEVFNDLSEIHSETTLIHIQDTTGKNNDIL